VHGKGFAIFVSRALLCLCLCLMPSSFLPSPNLPLSAIGEESRFRTNRHSRAPYRNSGFTKGLNYRTDNLVTVDTSMLSESLKIAVQILPLIQ